MIFMNESLKKKLQGLPKGPGVYFHKNADGEVIYVGKAAVLKNRVRQYFQSKNGIDAKTLALVDEITDVDWCETDSEIDALFLESEMVKRYKPRYNILLRDDKSATYVRINLKDEVPFVSFTRAPLDDGAEYVGPFFTAIAVKNALRYLRRSFPYFTKSNPTPLPRVGRSGVGSRLNQQMGLEPDISGGTESYKKSLRQLISYLKGNRVKVVGELEKSMKKAATRHDFETAATLRNQLYNLQELKKQVIFSREEFLDISRDQGLKELKELLNLKEVPRRIEGYDISHHGGQNNTGSMVVITNGIPDKAQYRKFKIHAYGNDDCKQMREVIERRLKHLNAWGKPDVVVLDGGKGQISAVANLLEAENIAYLARVKSGDHTRNSAVNIVLASGEIKALDPNSHLAKLVARLDDEAHRFAVSYHTLLKRKNMLK